MILLIYQFFQHYQSRNPCDCLLTQPQEIHVIGLVLLYLHGNEVKMKVQTLFFLWDALPQLTHHDCGLASKILAEKYWRTNRLCFTVESLFFPPKQKKVFNFKISPHVELNEVFVSSFSRVLKFNFCLLSQWNLATKKSQLISFRWRSLPLLQWYALVMPAFFFKLSVEVEETKTLPAELFFPFCFSFDRRKVCEDNPQETSPFHF